MNIAIIDVESERRIAARERLPKDERKSVPTAPWRVGSMLSRIVFFVLSSLALWWFYWLMKIFTLPAGIMSGAIGVATAELLARRRHFYRTGIETGLYLTALCSFIVSLPGEGKPEAILLFVLATLWVGVRLASALWLGASLALLLSYIGIKSESMIVPGLVCAALVGVALVLDQREWRRPTAQRLLALMLLVLPVAAAVLVNTEPFLHGDGTSHLGVVVITALFAAALIFEALRRRIRPLLGASVFVLVMCTGDLLVRFLAGEAVALLIGGSLVGASFALHRRLRGVRRGVTSDRWTEFSHESLIESGLAAVAGAAHTPSRSVEAAPAEGPRVATNDGSSFGGAGASGEY